MRKFEKILEEIEKAKREPWYRLNNYDVKHKLDGAINRIVEIIRKNMSSKDTDVPTNDGWIPVEERLPEEKELVLVQWEKYERHLNITLTYLDVMWLDDAEEQVFETINGVPNGRVIAWRSLPEPHRPERSEKKKEKIENGTGGVE